MSENPWLHRRVLQFAHQGGAREAPSSTLYALRRSVELGVDALELDVHRTADGVLVVCHDETVDRTSPASGRIDSFSLAQLRELDNAYWWAPGYDATTELAEHDYVLRGRHPHDPTLGFATLSEVLESFPDRVLNLDIKESAETAIPYETQLADLLRAYEATERVIVASFHDSALSVFRAYAPEIHTSCGLSESVAAVHKARAGLPIPRAESSQVAFQLPHYFDGERVVDDVFVRAAHAGGYAVHVWTVDEPEEMRQLLDAGVDGIITDCPSVLASVLAG